MHTSSAVYQRIDSGCCILGTHPPKPPAHGLPHLFLEDAIGKQYDLRNNWLLKIVDRNRLFTKVFYTIQYGGY